MKKFVSVLLSAILIFSVFSANCYAQSSDMLEEFFENLNGAEEITIKAVQYDSESEDGIHMVICRKSGALSMETEIPVGDEVPWFFGKIKVIIKDDSAKMFFPLIPIFSIEIPPEAIENVLLESGDLDLTFEGSTEKTVDGVKYFIETYSCKDGTTVQYAYSGEELVSITQIDSDGSFVSKMCIEEVSYKADWYRFLTPLITIDFEGSVDFDDLKISGIV